MQFFVLKFFELWHFILINNCETWKCGITARIIFVEARVWWRGSSGFARAARRVESRKWIRSYCHQLAGSHFDWKCKFKYCASEIHNFLFKMAKVATYKADDPSTFKLPPEFTYFPSFLYYLRRSQFVRVFGYSPDESAYFRHWLVLTIFYFIRKWLVIQFYINSLSRN